jgi:hypothetical protein
MSRIFTYFLPSNGNQRELFKPWNDTIFNTISGAFCSFVLVLVLYSRAREKQVHP